MKKNKKGLDFETLIAVKGKVRIAYGMSAQLTFINTAAKPDVEGAF